MQLHGVPSNSTPALILPPTTVTMGDKDAKASDASTSTWSGPTATRFENKAYSEYFDPCQDAAKRSIRCLHRNGGERAMCTDFFQAYRDCKEQWQNARKEARRKSSWFGGGLDNRDK